VGVEKFIPVVSAIFLHPVSALHGSRRVDSSAAEFRRRSQPAPYRAAAAGKKFGAPPRQPKFTEAAAAAIFVARCGASDSN